MQRVQHLHEYTDLPYRGSDGIAELRSTLVVAFAFDDMDWVHQSTHQFQNYCHILRQSLDGPLNWEYEGIRWEVHST